MIVELGEEGGTNMIRKANSRPARRRSGVTRRRFIAGAAAASGMLGAPWVLRFAHAAEITLKLSHMLPPVSLAHRRMFQPWAEKVNKESGGRIEVQIFPAMSLGGKPDLVDQARDGIADFSWALPNYQAGRFPVLETFTLPFLITTAEQTGQAIDEYMRAYGKAEFDFVHPLAWWCHGPALFMTKGKPVQKMADLKGLRIRGGNQNIVEALGLLGANPQSYPVTEVVTQLSKGTSQGAVIPYEIVPAFKLQELLDSFSEFERGGRGFYTFPFLFSMNRKKYESLPDDLRKVIDANSGPALSRKFGADFDFGDRFGRGLVEKAGGKFFTIPKAEVERWRVVSEPVSQKWIETLNRRNLDGKKLVTAANALVDKYAKAT
jgi:TRAP-type C4-dicarboxylate transport system substrate-binding protein